MAKKNAKKSSEMPDLLAHNSRIVPDASGPWALPAPSAVLNPAIADVPGPVHPYVGAWGDAGTTAVPGPSAVHQPTQSFTHPPNSVWDTVAQGATAVPRAVFWGNDQPHVAEAVPALPRSGMMDIPVDRAPRVNAAVAAARSVAPSSIPAETAAEMSQMRADAAQRYGQNSSSTLGNRSEANVWARNSGPIAPYDGSNDSRFARMAQLPAEPDYVPPESLNWSNDRVRQQVIQNRNDHERNAIRGPLDSRSSYPPARQFSPEQRQEAIDRQRMQDNLRQGNVAHRAMSDAQLARGASLPYANWYADQHVAPVQSGGNPWEPMRGAPQGDGNDMNGMAFVHGPKAATEMFNAQQNANIGNRNADNVARGNEITANQNAAANAVNQRKNEIEAQKVAQGAASSSAALTNMALAQTPDERLHWYGEYLRHRGDEQRQFGSTSPSPTPNSPQGTPISMHPAFQDGPNDWASQLKQRNHDNRVAEARNFLANDEQSNFVTGPETGMFAPPAEEMRRPAYKFLRDRNYSHQEAVDAINQHYGSGGDTWHLWGDNGDFENLRREHESRPVFAGA